MAGSYSRLGYGAMITETTENVAVKPTNFFGLTGENILTKWGVKPSSNIFADRNILINAIKNKVDAPMGTIDVMMEPLNFGYFLKGVFGTPLSGQYFPIVLRLSAGAVTGTAAVYATLSQATSGATAVVTAVNTGSFDVRNITVGFDATHLVTGTNVDGTTFTFTPSAILAAGTFTVGEVITGATSAKTATVVAVSNELDYLIVSSPSGAFTALEKITGGTSSKTATLLTTDNTVYGHEFKGPQNTPPTFTLEIGYQNEAIRFMGVRFSDFKSIKDKDNIMTAQVGVFARSAFISARVQAAVSTGATKTILLDQTLGLTTSDTIKVFRPGTGYLDFSAGSVKTSTITTVNADVSIVVGNVQTALVSGDLIVLAPQTPSYTVAKEFSWIGGSIGRVADTITAVITAVAAGMETSDFSVVNETDQVHAANGLGVKDRFPTANFFKAFKVSGKFKAYYQDNTFLDRLRNSTQTGIQIVHTGSAIGATLMNYILDWRYTNCVAKEFTNAMQDDNILTQEIPFDMFKSSADGYTAKSLLVVDKSSYAS